MMKEVNGQTRLCGLVGYPVQHTLSPVIHNYLAEATGTNLVYVPFEVEKNLDAAVRGAFALNVLGMNVTVPYKKDVMDSLVEIDENAERIGAVNTLVRMEQGYKGYNTDYLGLKRAMESDGVSIQGEDVIVLGAGGAANAVVYLCAQLGAKSVTVLNRTVQKAQQLVEHVEQYYPDTEYAAINMEDYGTLEKKAYTVIQATSFGLHPNVENVVIEDESFYQNIRQAVDIIYNPEETKFMRLVKAAGGKAYNGLKMLLYQGVIAYELWNDITVEEEVCHEVYECLQKQFQQPDKECAAKNVILIGFMGAGKTTIGKMLSEECGSSFLDTDFRIEQEQNCSIRDIFDKEGEKAFRKMETQLLERLVQEGYDGVLSVGGGLPVQKANHSLLKQAGVTVYLKAGEETLVQRLKGDTTRPLLQEEKPECKIRQLMAEREAIYEQVADYVIQTDGMAPEDVVKKIRDFLEKGKK